MITPGKLTVTDPTLSTGSYLLTEARARVVLCNARRIAGSAMKRRANWALAMELFGLGSTMARVFCESAGVDPDGLTAEPACRIALQGKQQS